MMEQHDENMTVSSMGLDSAAYHPGSRAFASPATVHSGATSAAKSARQVLDKIANLKSSAQKTSDKLRDLKRELQQILTVQEKRRRKTEENCEQQIQRMKEEHESTMREMKAFHARLVGDLKKLEDQQLELQNRMRKQDADREVALEEARKEASKRIAKARRQWEADERVHFEKVLSSRNEQLKKQAADSFTPKLDEMVRTGKEKVEALRQEGEANLAKLKASLEADIDNKLMEYRSAMNQEMQEELDKAKKVGSKRLDEMQRKLEQESAVFKERFDQEKRRILDKAEEIQQAEHENHQASLKSLHEKEALFVRELLDRQQQEVAALLRMQSENITKLKDSLQLEFEDHQNKVNRIVAQRENDAYKQLHQRALAEIASECESVILKLQSEANTARKAKQDIAAKEIESNRLRVENKIESARANEEK